MERSSLSEKLESPDILATADILVCTALELRRCVSPMEERSELAMQNQTLCFLLSLSLIKHLSLIMLVIVLSLGIGSPDSRLN